VRELKNLAGRGRRTRDRSRRRFRRCSVRIVVYLHRTLTKRRSSQKTNNKRDNKGIYRTGTTRKKGQGDIVLRSEHNRLDLMFIVGVAVGGSSWKRKTLDTGTLEINNQYCVRKKRTERTLEGVASEGVLSGAGCLAVLNRSSRDGDDDIQEKDRHRWLLMLG